MSFKHDYDSEVWYNFDKVRKMYLAEKRYDDDSPESVMLVWENGQEEQIFSCKELDEAIDFMNNLMEIEEQC